ncbi:MAG: TolC family outer membrane protein [Pseudomonadota bacterium]
MKRTIVALAASAVICGGLGLPKASAQSLTDSFTSAYSNNPSLNLARSQLRGVDEQIAIARSGNRPNLSGAIQQSFETTRSILRTSPPLGVSGRSFGSNDAPTVFSISLTQPLFRGFQVRNAIRGAESSVRAQRSSLQNTEQNILLDTATAFFDVILNRQVVTLRRNDVSFLGEQIRAAQDRFEVGEGTRTDVSQAEARQAQAEALLNEAIADLSTSEASYKQLTGLEAGTLRDDITEARFVPPSLQSAIQIGQNIHPAIRATLFDVDTASFNVAQLEGQFLPSLEVVGNASTALNRSDRRQDDAASISLNLSVPIYQGGRVSAEVRQAKEQLGSARIQVDVTRDSIRQFTVASWARNQAALRSIQTSRTGVFAAQLALQGVIEEQRVGQRTTLDVLDAQRELIDAQLTLVFSERDRDVTTYTLLSAIGNLNAERLGLNVAIYRPEEHTDAIRDKWFGLRTPDGR